MPLLLAKVRELLPDLVGTLCEGMEESAGDVNLGEVMSPHTRGVYEEEVGSGLYEDLRRKR